MFFRVASVPFYIFWSVARLFLGVAKTGLLVVAGFLRFFGGRLFGATIGVLLGFLLGSKHIGIKINGKR